MTAPDLDALLASASEIPGLAVGLLAATYSRPLAETRSPAEAVDALRLDGPAPLKRSEAVRLAVRDLLRGDGYKPTGRGKPSPEYLVKAAEGGFLGPINAAVDVCNAVSLHSGLPISVVDLDRAAPPLAIAVGGPEDAYEFNASGQVIQLAGLVGVRDVQGFCANPVRDSQRTKTHDRTTRTLSVVWAPRESLARLREALAWYEHLVAASGAVVGSRVG
ncbi:phenylalanine--tRNA ligase beta subunit-related protein [Rubrivirga sp. IMCC45206]|uniref:phenylalanine--tRNA ligase beta subunit-related protein n=1 Tax=Rubrivirga sp. IMCC45206 TaxID=3391614 RepID=UPI00398FF12B